MQFRVPQFLDIEDKVFGPFTFKQFGYMLGAIAFTYIFWKLLPTYLSIPLIIIISGTFLGLGFVEINGRKFGDVLESFIKYFLNAKIFIWKKKEIINNLGSYNQTKLNERLLIQEKEKKNIDQKKGEIKHYNFEQIQDLARKLDILQVEKKEKTNINLREEILKERHGFKL